MRLDQAAGYVEAESQAPAVVLAGLREPFEHGLERVGGYARTAIRDRQANLAVDTIATDDDFSARRGELERIGDQVGEHLEDTVMVERRSERSGRQPRLHADA